MVAACPSQKAGLYASVTGAGSGFDRCPARYLRNCSLDWRCAHADAGDQQILAGRVLAPFGILDAGRHSVDGEDVHTAA